MPKRSSVESPPPLIWKTAKDLTKVNVAKKVRDGVLLSATVGQTEFDETMVASYRERLKQIMPTIPTLVKNNRNLLELEGPLKNVDLFQFLGLEAHVTLRFSDILNSHDPICQAITTCVENNIIETARLEDVTRSAYVYNPSIQQPMLSLVRGENTLNLKNSQSIFSMTRVRASKACVYTQKAIAEQVKKFLPQAAGVYLNSYPLFLEPMTIRQLSPEDVERGIEDFGHLLRDDPEQPTYRASCRIKLWFPVHHQDEHCLGGKTLLEVSKNAIEDANTTHIMLHYTMLRDRQKVLYPALYDSISSRREAFTEACEEVEKGRLQEDYHKKREDAKQSLKRLYENHPEEKQKLFHVVEQRLLKTSKITYYRKEKENA